MKGVTYAGVGISVVGALLDFASGSSLGQTTPMPGEMASPPFAPIAFYLLGTAILITGGMMALPRLAVGMRKLGVAMEVFGVIMALVSYWLPGMSLGLSYAMLFVGAAMILNGALMQRGGRAMGASA